MPWVGELIVLPRLRVSAKVFKLVKREFPFLLPMPQNEVQVGSFRVWLGEFVVFPRYYVAVQSANRAYLALS